MNPVSVISSAVRTAQGAVPSPKLVKAAQDFEAILLSGWMEKLQASFNGPNDGSDPAHETLASMGTQAIASALAARGGIGVAKLLLQHLSNPVVRAESIRSESEKKELSGAKVSQNIADSFR